MKHKQPRRKASPSRKQNHISKDGKWETMARPTGLMRYLPSGVYFARVRYKKKLIGPRSLKTTDYDQAKERLPLRIQEWKKKADKSADEANESKVKPTLWSDASAKFVQESESLETLGVIQEGALQTRDTLARKILHYWPSIANKPVRELMKEEILQFFVEAKQGEKRFKPCKRPAGKCKQKGAFLGGPQGVGQLQLLLWAAKQITQKAILMDNSKGLGAFLSPFVDVELPKEATQLPSLPSEAQFEEILEYVKNRPRGGLSAEQRFRAWAGLNFLSMSGLRIGELIGSRAKVHPHPELLWEDIRDDVERPYIYVKCEKKRKGEKWRRRRKVPFYGGRDGSMMELICELRKRWYTGNPKDPVFKGVSLDHGFNKYLATACKNLKIIHDGKPLVLSQHDLRDVFATRCVEGGADWKTLSEWLGHEDGGILAAKIYTRSRDDHSFEIAERLGKHKRREKHETTLESNQVCQFTVDGKTYTADAVRGMLARLREAEAGSTDAG